MKKFASLLLKVGKTVIIEGLLSLGLTVAIATISALALGELNDLTLEKAITA